MEIEIVSVTFMPKGCIEIVYLRNGALDRTQIKTGATLRNVLDDMLLGRIKELLGFK